MPPLSPSHRELYARTVDAQMLAYERLIEILKSQMANDYYERFPARSKQRDRWDAVVEKRTYEVARYVLGVGTVAYLYHTLNALTLLRYSKLCKFFETPTEQQAVVAKMLEKVNQADPLFERELSDSISPEDTIEYQLLNQFLGHAVSDRESFIRNFDSGLENRSSKLVGWTVEGQALLARAVRLALASENLTDEQALCFVLDPAHNKILADSLNPSGQDKLSQVLRHLHFVFEKKLSHCADSQDQRHRAVPSSLPVLFLHYNGKPDYVTPYAITENPLAGEIYSECMEHTFKVVNDLLNGGVSREFAFYLLPNALSIRMMTSGELLSLHHKWKLRSCYNAQEEIFRATVEEIAQVQERFPHVGRFLRAPCFLRKQAGKTPYCPEGERFCGLPVWNYEISQYQRRSL
ncbi:MAG: FAD-dependent thymidylate synthase [Deltaproteobacteria bacterium]|nr:FAD-dependent thymidylate synthase [Deltaproteobacteria bacterium]